MTERQKLSDRVRVLASERARRVLAALLAVLIGIPVALFLATPANLTPLGVVATMVFLVIDVWCVVYTVATFRTFHNADHATLQELVAPKQALNHLSPTMRILRSGSNGPTQTAWFAGLALFAAVVLPRIHDLAPDERGRITLTILATIAVVVGWAVLTLSYAVHYLRLDIIEDGLDFPGNNGNEVFFDYVYFAIGVAFTYGATDVSVTTPRMRRVVVAHGTLAFIYCSAIVALLVSVIL